MSLDTLTNQSSANHSGLGSSISPDIDSPFIYLSDDMLKMFHFTNNVILTPTICALGITGNSFGLAVLKRQRGDEVTSFFIYIRALMVIHLIYLCVGVVRSVPELIEVYDTSVGNYLKTRFRVYGIVYFDMVMNHTATAIIILMSMERLLSLYKPMTVKETWIAKYPKQIMSVVFVLFILYLLPFLMYFDVLEFQNADNQTMTKVIFKQEFQLFMTKYSAAETVILHFVAPLIVLLINIAIPIVYACKLKRQHLKIKRTNGEGSRQWKITMIVVCIMVLFLLLSLPNLIIQAFAVTNNDYSFSGKYNAIFYFFIDLGNQFTYLNAACDSVIYMFITKKYVHFCKMVYCTCCVVSQNKTGLKATEISTTTDSSSKYTDRFTEISESTASNSW